MSVYVAFLRAINVGGHAVVKMIDLRDAFGAAGCRNVRTYIASGNVVFDAPEKGTKALFGAVRARLADLLGSEPAVGFRTLDDIDAIIASDPFGRLHDETAVKLYVAFPCEKAPITQGFPMSLPKEGLEAFALEGHEVFIVSRPKPNGSYGFPGTWIDKAMGVPVTTRNWTTVRRIAAFARSKT
jgi:uncharacterized protein (DUF1697 family)